MRCECKIWTPKCCGCEEQSGQFQISSVYFRLSLNMLHFQQTSPLASLADSTLIECIARSKNSSKQHVSSSSFTTRESNQSKIKTIGNQQTLVQPPSDDLDGQLTHHDVSYRVFLPLLCLGLSALRLFYIEDHRASCCLAIFVRLDTLLPHSICSRIWYSVCGGTFPLLQFPVGVLD